MNEKKIKTMDVRKKSRKCRFCKQSDYAKLECTSRKIIPLEERENMRQSPLKLEPSTQLKELIADTD